MARFSKDNSFDPFDLVKEAWAMLIFCVSPKKGGWVQTITWKKITLLLGDPEHK